MPSYPNSTLLLAGDVGNHELWLRGSAREQYTSFDKLQQVEQVCRRLGVETSAALIGGHTWVVPLMSWYHADWDTQPDIPGAMQIHKDDTLARYFDELNNARVHHVVRAQQAHPILTMSHFLPREELLPPKHALLVPNLPKASGSRYLTARIHQQLHPLVHVFGHTHIARDMVLDGVRYVQQPLDYPKARRRWGLPAYSPVMIYQAAEEGSKVTDRCELAMTTH